MSFSSKEEAKVYCKPPGRGSAVSDRTPLLANGSVQTRSIGASFASFMFNLMNGIMGSGILGLAYAMASTGIVGFCILLSLVSILAAYSIHLLLKLCDQTGINSYEGLGEKALKKPGKVLVGVAILIQNICVMSSYLFILKSELPEAISSLIQAGNTGNAWYLDGRLLVIIVTFGVVVPLAMLPKIGFLGYTSGLAFIFMLYFTVVVVVKKWSNPCLLPHNITTLSDSEKNLSRSPSYNLILSLSSVPDGDCTPKLFVLSIKSSYVIPTMAFSSLCHTAILPIYCELKRPTKARMQDVANISISLSFLLYLISALFGYLTFYSHVKSELQLGFGVCLPRDVMVMTVRLAILLSVLLTVPLIHFPARKVLIALLYGGRQFSWLTHVVSGFLLLGVVLMLAIFVTDIKNVYGVVGSTMSSCLLFVFPGLFYLKISTQPLISVDSIGAIFLLLFGLMMGLTSLTVIVLSWVLCS